MAKKLAAVNLVGSKQLMTQFAGFLERNVQGSRLRNRMKVSRRKNGLHSITVYGERAKSLIEMLWKVDGEMDMICLDRKAQKAKEFLNGPILSPGEYKQMSVPCAA